MCIWLKIALKLILELESRVGSRLFWAFVRRSEGGGRVVYTLHEETFTRKVSSMATVVVWDERGGVNNMRLREASLHQPPFLWSGVLSLVTNHQSYS